MAQEHDLNVSAAMRAKTHVENAARWAGLLQNVLTYARTDHIGLIHGDGELTRYMQYLARQVCEQTAFAGGQMGQANIPDELPF